MTTQQEQDQQERRAEERRREVARKLFGGPYDLMSFASTEQLYSDIRMNCTVNNDLQEEAYYDVISSTVFLSFRMNEFNFTPYLHLLGPPDSGKTRLEEWLRCLAKNPLHTASMSPPSLYQVINEYHPTLLVDETDRFGKENSEHTNAMLQILNSGQRRGTPAVRASKEGGVPFLYDVFCLKVLAGTEELPDTLASRCIRLNMEHNVRPIPVEIDTGITGVLRCQLEKYETFHDTTPIVNLEELSPVIGNNRIVEQFYPLVSICPSLQARKRLVELAKEMAQTRRDQEGTGQEAEVLESLLRLRQEIEGQLKLAGEASLTRLQVSKIAEHYNLSHQNEPLSSDIIGRILRARLGLKHARLGKESRRSVWVNDRKKLARKCARFLPELVDEFFPELGQPAEVTVVTEETVREKLGQSIARAVTAVSSVASTSTYSSDGSDASDASGGNMRVQKDLCAECFNRKYAALNVKRLGPPTGGSCDDCGGIAGVRVGIL
jgi:hypothetical protein